MTKYAPLTPPERISVLLAEYASLRAEILQRNTVLNSTLGGAIAATIALIGFALNGSTISLLLLIPIWAITFVVFRLLEFDTLEAAKRLREIEGAVNSMAKETLMTWETDHGLPKVGYLERLRYVISWRPN